MPSTRASGKGSGEIDGASNSNKSRGRGGRESHGRGASRRRSQTSETPIRRASREEVEMVDNPESILRKPRNSRSPSVTSSTGSRKGSRDRRVSTASQVEHHDLSAIAEAAEETEVLLEEEDEPEATDKEIQEVEEESEQGTESSLETRTQDESIQDTAMSLRIRRTQPPTWMTSTIEGTRRNFGHFANLTNGQPELDVAVKHPSHVQAPRLIAPQRTLESWRNPRMSPSRGKYFFHRIDVEEREGSAMPFVDPIAGAPWDRKEFSREKVLWTHPDDDSSEEQVDRPVDRVPLDLPDWKRLLLVFREHAKEGLSYWLRKKHVFWTCFGLACSVLVSMLCSAGSICQNQGWLNVLIRYFFHDSWEFSCILGLLVLILIGISDVGEAVIKIWTMFGRRAARQAPGKNKDTGWLFGILWWQFFFHNVPWLNMGKDFVNEALDPLLMLILTLAFRDLIWWSSSDAAKGCWVSVCLHVIKWTASSLEDVYLPMYPWTYPRRPIKRPVFVGVVSLLLLAAIYKHWELLYFSIPATWRYATAFRHGEGYLRTGNDTVLVIDGTPSRWTGRAVKIVYRVTTKFVTGAVFSSGTMTRDAQRLVP